MLLGALGIYFLSVAGRRQKFRQGWGILGSAYEITRGQLGNDEKQIITPTSKSIAVIIRISTGTSNRIRAVSNP